MKLSPAAFSRSLKGRRYVEMGGSIHMVNPLSGGSHTLCGVAHDAADTERDDQLRWFPTGLITVECPDCITVIKACRDQMIREPGGTTPTPGGAK